MTDEEINQRVATEVMGWIEQGEYGDEWHSLDGLFLTYDLSWKPCTDLDQACLAGNKLIERGVIKSWAVETDRDRTPPVSYIGSICRVEPVGLDSDYYQEVTCESPGKAICLILLLACGIET